MKKIYYLTTMIVLCALAASSQSTIQPVTKKMKANPEQQLQNNFSLPVAHHSSRNRAVIWTDDFSTPANWTIDHGAGTFNDWVIGTTPPSGGFAIDTIESTSAANGYALFDSDMLCDTTNGQIGNLTNVTAINCSTHPNVQLVFQEYYRRFYDSTFVYVSNNGTTWVKFTVNPSLAIQDYSGSNPTTVKVNISSVAGNQATVYVRFTFYSPADLQQGFAGCGYAWMVDDVSLEDIPLGDVSMSDGSNFPSEYTIIPLPQVQGIPITAKVVNNGASTVNNVSYLIDIFKDDFSTNVYSQTSSVVASLNAGDTTASISAGTFTPADTGIYIFQYVAYLSTDLDHSNDTMYRFLIVDEASYARDFAAISGTVDNALGFNGATGKLAQVYHMAVAGTITSVSFFLSDANLGDTVTASIYNFNGTLPTTLIATTPTHYIQAADLGGAFITYNFTTPVAVGAGNYVISIDQVSHTNITLGFSNNIFTPNREFFKAGTNPWTPLSAANFPGAFILRPDVTGPVGINEHAGVNQFDVFPNPSNGKVFIHNTERSNGQLSVEVFNNLGQMVYSNKYNNMQNVVVDMSSKPVGVYSFVIKTENNTVTKMIMIN